MDEFFLKLAIKEAQKSKKCNGYKVGAVIVKNGLVLSKAYSLESKKYRHAEELAIKKCKENLSGSIIYCTMEPCDYRRSGKKTCCEHIIESKIKKVVYGVFDPDTYVHCSGIEKLKQAGVEVYHLKTLEQKCKELTPSLPFDKLQLEVAPRRSLPA